MNYASSTDKKKENKNLRRILINDSGLKLQDSRTSTAFHSERLKQAQKPQSGVSELILRKHDVDAVLAGYLQDLLCSKEAWDIIELRTNPQIVLRLLETMVLQKKQRVDRLIIRLPTEAIVTWLAKNLDQLTVNSLSLRSPISSELAIRRFGSGISKHSTLQELSLAHCQLEDEEIAKLVEYFHDNTSLQTLDLAGNFCQEQGTKAVSNLLVSAKSCLRALDLSGQDVWDDRSYVVHLTRALAHPNCQLEKLDVSSNFWNDENFQWLLEALLQQKRDQNRRKHSLQAITLRDNSISDIGIEYLTKALPDLAPSLRYLNLKHNDEITENCVSQRLEDMLSRTTSLWHLELDRPTTRLVYYLALNRGGRVCKHPNQIPLSVWPLVLARTKELRSTYQYHEQKAGITQADLIFDLLHGPVLLER